MGSNLSRDGRHSNRDKKSSGPLFNVAAANVELARSDDVSTWLAAQTSLSFAHRILEIEKVNPDLITRDEGGKPTTVRYEAVNAMLLNEFLKEHRNVTEQQSTIAELKATVAKQQDAFVAKIAQQQKQIEALTATVQKVSDQIALSKPLAQLVANP